MSKLEELIAEFCPDGVEYMPLGDICEIYDGTHQTPKYTTEGVKFASVENINAPFETKKYISREDYEKNYKIKPRLQDVLMTRIGTIGTCAIIDKDEDLAYYVTLTLIRPNQTKVLSKYMKYIIESGWGKTELRKRTLIQAVPIKINLGEIGKIFIPVPPLPVQREIVRILNNCAELTTKLIAELTAELTARKKQYEYYRDMLLNFEDQQDVAVQWMTLGEIGPVCMCKRIMKAETSAEGDVPFYKIGTFGKEANAYITWETFEKYKSTYSYPKKGDILISAAGTIGRTVVFNGEPAYFQDSNIVWIDNDETKVLNRFLLHCYAMKPWSISTGGTIARLYNDNILKAKIPVPALEEQGRIVDMLDRLDAICNKMFSGLPAEIEARRKQYVYYLDKLLTFQEVTTA